MSVCVCVSIGEHVCRCVHLCTRDVPGTGEGTLCPGLWLPNLPPPRGPGRKGAAVTGCRGHCVPAVSLPRPSLQGTDIYSVMITPGLHTPQQSIKPVKTQSFYGRQIEKPINTQPSITGADRATGRGETSVNRVRLAGAGWRPLRTPRPAAPALRLWPTPPELGVGRPAASQAAAERQVLGASAPLSAGPRGPGPYPLQRAVG